jgi:hypothetical protein
MINNVRQSPIKAGIFPIPLIKYDQKKHLKIQDHTD